MIHGKFVKFVQKPIVFKQEFCVEDSCRGFEVKGRKSWDRANTPSLYLFITCLPKSKDNGKTI